MLRLHQANTSRYGFASLHPLKSREFTALYCEGIICFYNRVESVKVVGWELADSKALHMLYHEKQVAALCGVHCINTLLQGPYFSEVDLAQIGHDLDQLERQMLDAEVLAVSGPSSNLDESGMFSIQVLAKALQVWNLTAIPFSSKELREAPGGFDPQHEQAFICNLQEHWFTIRKIDGDWWNFNSLYPAPEPLSAFYLTAYLDSLRDQGYTIFVIRGGLPPAAAAPGTADMEGPGKWWDTEEARSAHQSARESRQLGRAKNAMEEALARTATAGGALTLRKRGAQDMTGDDEDADLAAAIAASMQDSQSAGIDPPGPVLASGSSGRSYAAAARQASGADMQGMADRSASHDVQHDDFAVYDEDDPELAAALAASLEEHNSQQQEWQQVQDDKQQANHQHQQEQQQQQQLPEVPEEPPEDSENVITVAFRLPSGGRLSRRFVKSDTVAVLQAYVLQELLASGDVKPGQQVQLATQFPKTELTSKQLNLEAAGVENRSMLSVTIV